MSYACAKHGPSEESRPTVAGPPVWSESMKIDPDKLDSMERTLVRMVDAQPPRAVYTALLALVDPDKHVASWTEWDPAPDTVWRAWFVTDAAIAFVALKFNQQGWYRGPEEDLYGREKSIPTNTQEAWVRPLDTVTKVDVAGFGTPLGSRREEQPLHGVVLTFADGSTAVLPSQESVHRDSRAALDEFTSAVMNNIPFWG